MTISPTDSGGLKLLPEEMQDWLVLMAIPCDGEVGLGLAEHFAALMDEDSMWDDIVVPELQTEFTAQREKIDKIIMSAHEEGADEIHIEPQDAEDWYGALNQARLSIEQRYRFGPRELQNPEDIEDSETRSAYYRNEFYGNVQALLLEHVMED